MSFAARTILRAATRPPNGPLNILDFVTHERYQSNLAKTGHNFYLINCQTNGVKGGWNTNYAPIPQNYFHLPRVTNQETIIYDIINSLPTNIDFDLIISHQKFGQFQLAAPIASILHLPIISLEHTLPIPSWSPDTLPQLKSFQGHTNLFISEYSRKEWGWGEKEADIIHHGIDLDKFMPGDSDPKKQTLSIVNDWVNRDYACGFNLWQTVIKGFPYKVLGDTPGLSKAAQTTEELVSAYQESQVFVNTSLISPIPTVVLEAMACGLPIVSTNNCMLPEVIEHGVNGYLTNDVKEMRDYIDYLLINKKAAKKMGEAARKTIEDKFSLKSFINNWNKILYKTANRPYTNIRPSL